MERKIQLRTQGKPTLAHINHFCKIGQEETVMIFLGRTGLLESGHSTNTFSGIPGLRRLKAGFSRCSNPAPAIFDKQHIHLLIVIHSRQFKGVCQSI